MAKKNNETCPIYVVRVAEKLVGEFQYDRDQIAALPAGTRIKANLTAGRSSSRLRAYWSMLNDVVNATDIFPDAETLHLLVKLKTGYVTPVKLSHSNQTVLLPRSVSFAAMDETEFARFFKRAERFFAEEFGIDLSEIGTAA